MPLATLRSHLRSLRARLMLWNAGAVAATGLLILVAVRTLVGVMLIKDLEEVLVEDLQEIKLNFPAGQAYHWDVIKEELERKAQGHQYHRWFVRFFNDSDQPIWASHNAPDLPPPTPEQKERKSYSIESDIENYLVSHGRLDRPVAEGAYFCVGCSQAYVERDMVTIDRLVIFAGFIVLLISPLVGHLLTGQVIRPLAQMISTTERLHPGEVSERLPIRGTGDELDSLAHTINGLLDRIATYLKQEHDFLANAAHDLRTPLAAIRSSVEVALGVQRSDEEYRETLGLVIEQCSYLQTLVNQLLLLAETDADRLQPDNEPVRLDLIVARVVAMFEGVADEHHIELRTAEIVPASVPGKRHHLHQVVSNLLDNAIKFTGIKFIAAGTGDGAEDNSAQKGSVTVELTRDEAAQVALLKVQDNGVGIAAEDQAQIFDRFYRGDKARGRDSAVGGTGLGLSICKAIVESHGGTIAVESEAALGTTFTVTLPLHPVQPSEPMSEEDEQVLGLP